MNRRFRPVFLPDGDPFAASSLGGRVSVTFGRTENSCSRAGFLYAKYKGAASTHPMERGSALHRVLELATREATAPDRDAATIPPEIVKAIVNEVLADPAYRTPVEEHDYLRESAFRWAEHATFETGTLIACETLFVLDIGGYEMRGRIDRADLVEDGGAVAVEDYKSSRSMPAYEDIGRRLTDGSERVAAKDYQLVLYALLLAFGVPVRIDTCTSCGGRGGGMPESSARLWRARGADPEDAPDTVECDACGGNGYTEVREPFGVAENAQRFDLAYVFPGIDVDGKPGRREVSLTRLELAEYMASIEAQMARVSEAERSGDWPATSGSHCNECPCEPECPIPRELRDFAGAINTLPELQEAAERYVREKERMDARWKEIKASVRHLAPGERLRVGRDRVIEPVLQKKTVIRDKDAMWAAVEAQRLYGRPFRREDHERVQESTPIALRRLSAEELEAEAAGEIIESEGSNA